MHYTYKLKLPNALFEKHFLQIKKHETYCICKLFTPINTSILFKILQKLAAQIVTDFWVRSQTPNQTNKQTAMIFRLKCWLQSCWNTISRKLDILAYSCQKMSLFYWNTNSFRRQKSSYIHIKSLTISWPKFVNVFFT